MSPGNSSERRRYARASLSLPVRLSVDRLGVRTSLFNADISEGGLFVQTDLQLPAGTAVAMEIYLGHPAGRMEAKGRVVRSRRGPGQDPANRPGLAIEFTEHQDAGWDLLRDLIRASRA